MVDQCLIQKFLAKFSSHTLDQFESASGLKVVLCGAILRLIDNLSRILKVDHPGQLIAERGFVLLRISFNSWK